MTTIDDFLHWARNRLQRVKAEDLAAEVDAGAVVVDIRPEDRRREEGTMPGALVIDRNVLEWRLAPSSEARILDVEPGQKVILFCNDGYASSLAAVTLIDLGVLGATDLDGGYREWKRLQSEDPQT